MDPLIAGKMMDRFGVHSGLERPEQKLYHDIMLLLASMGVAMVSRIAKNFQDYFVNVVVQRSRGTNGPYMVFVIHFNCHTRSLKTKEAVRLWVTPESKN